MSEGVFVVEGRPMVFALENSPKTSEIRAMVESGGGELISTWREGAVHLAMVEPQAPLPFAKPADHPVYTYHFVLDSLRLKDLQDLDMYELGKEDVEEEVSPTKAVRSRTKFTFNEEQAMREYMTKYPGPFTSVSYWMKATAYGLAVHRSADTLRDHCKRMMKGKTISDSPVKPGNKPTKRPRPAEQAAKLLSASPKRPIPTYRHSSPRVALPMRPIQSTPKARSESCISDLANTPFSLSSRFENSPALLITVSKRGREVQDMDALKRKCLRDHIPDKFKSLVARCQQRSKQPIDEAEILQVLLQLGGSAEKTEEYFERYLG